MKLLDLSPDSPLHTLAADEVLLDLCEEGSGDEALRFWEPRSPFVVLGHSCRVVDDVDLDACAARNIPVLRRHSGGGTVLQLPGCLNYALVLRIDRHRDLETISGTNIFVLERVRRALQSVTGQEVRVDGHTDLVLGGRKFCGNAQRRRLRALLFHGVMLLEADIPLIEAVLRVPPRQPTYRNNRPHAEFLTNTGWAMGVIKRGLCKEWNAEGDYGEIPPERIEELSRTKYGTREWTHLR